MNISKAKNVLILAFLVLNIILAYQLLAPGLSGLSAGVTPEEVQRMEEKLEDNNFELASSLPHRPQNSSFITVKPPARTPAKLKEAFFAGEDVHTINLEDKTVLEAGEQELNIWPGGHYRYSYQNDVSGGEDVPLDAGEAVSKAEEFLAEKGLFHNNMRKGQIHRVDEKTYKITFYQEFMESPIFTSYKRIVVSRDRVTEMESYWLQVKGMEERRKMEVIPAATAVIRLLEEKSPEAEQREITDIELGFFSQEYDAEKWEIPPVWRIIVSDEEVYYVNAFIGNIENDDIQE